MEYSKPAVVTAAVSRVLVLGSPRWVASQSPMVARRSGPGLSASWPPGYQITFTVPPAWLICLAVASAWSRPNRVSCSPCTSRVGAVMCSATDTGDTLCSRSMVCWLARPVVATST